jgi:FkbM family methyltransferase
VPSITALARETIELNKAGGNVTINQMALTSSAGSLIVNTFAGLPHSHASHVDLGRTDASPNVCVSTTIDTYVSDAGIRRVDLIKADVEGHELAVFAGGEGLLTRDDAPILAFELNPACLAHHGTSGTELLALLRRLGYTHVWRLSAKGGPTRLSGNGPATNTTVVACKPGKVGLVRTGIAAA